MLLNERIENIGARRLHTVLSTLLEDLLFDLPEVPVKRVVFDAQAVQRQLMHVVEDEDLRKYIL
jgi:ATP-dependent HslUV protease ATP-binding subunit HslU